MFSPAVAIIAILLSLYLWGFIRTSIWLIPSILLKSFLPFGATALLSFWTAVALTAPYRDGAFDLRGFSRQRWIFVFFISGVLSGTLYRPTTVFAFAIGALVPLLFLQVFRLLRQPANSVLYLPKNLRWIIPGLWLVCLGLQILDLGKIERAV